jgi:hypothetical protein
MPDHALPQPEAERRKLSIDRPFNCQLWPGGQIEIVGKKTLRDLGGNEQRWIGGIGHRHERRRLRIDQQIEWTSPPADAHCAIPSTRGRSHNHIGACDANECKNNRLDQKEFPAMLIGTLPCLRVSTAAVCVDRRKLPSCGVAEYSYSRCNQASSLERVQSTTKELSGRTHAAWSRLKLRPTFMRSGRS